MKGFRVRMALASMATVCLAIFSFGLDGAVHAREGQNAGDRAEKTVDPALQRRAAVSLRRLKQAIQRDRYPSALAALNIWRADAVSAGVFDPETFTAYQRQIYEKSVENILQWFEVCIKEKWIREADYCQRVYRLHAKAIDAFDQDRYDEMTKKIEKRRKEIEAEKERRRTASSTGGKIPADGQ